MYSSGSIFYTPGSVYSSGRMYTPDSVYTSGSIFYTPGSVYTPGSGNSVVLYDNL